MTKADMNLWKNNPIQFWQNQLNFAVWCATAGGRVSIKFLFNHEDKMVRSLYRFHIYYTIRRILSEMKCTLPRDTLWSAFNNNINIEYQWICREFGVDNKISWCVDDGFGDLGRAYSSKGLIGSGVYNSSMIFDEDSNVSRYRSYKKQVSGHS